MFASVKIKALYLYTITINIIVCQKLLTQMKNSRENSHMKSLKKSQNEKRTPLSLKFGNMEKRDERILAIANDLKSDDIAKGGIFVDLPNGNKGLIFFTIIDFGIKTKNPPPDKIVKSSYAVELPEMKMAMEMMRKR